MQFLNIDWTVLILITGSVIGLAIISILTLLNRDKSIETILLILILFCLLLILLANIAYQTDFFLSLPHLYRAFSFTSFCIGPLSYLYVRTSLQQSYRLKQTDWLLFIPAMAYLIHRLPFITLSSKEKLDFISEALNRSTPIMAEPEGLLPPGYAATLRLLTGLVFIGAQIYLLVSHQFRQPITPLSQQAQEENRNRFKWLSTFTGILLSGYMLVVLATYFQLSENKFIGNLTTIAVSLTVISIAITLFTKPRLLYGMTGWFTSPHPIPENSEFKKSSLASETLIDNSKSRISSLTEIQRSLIAAAIQQFLQSTETFLKPGFSIRDLSKEIDVPLYQLSSFINQEYGKNYSEWINDQRIDHFVQAIAKDPKYRNYTIQHIGETLGFRSRTSFIAAVKKRTGKTPSELITQ